MQYFYNNLIFYIPDVLYRAAGTVILSDSAIDSSMYSVIFASRFLGITLRSFFHFPEQCAKIEGVLMIILGQTAF